MSGFGSKIGADERVREQVDVIPDNHEVSHMVGKVGAAGGVGDDERPDTHANHDADGKHHLVHAVSFIIVDAALHGDDGFAAQLSYDEISFMPHGRGDREFRQLAVGDDHRVFDVVGQAA